MSNELKEYCWTCDTLYLSIKMEQERSNLLEEALVKLLAGGDRNTAIETLHSLENRGENEHC